MSSKKNVLTVRITDPDGKDHVIPVKLSTQIRLEEQFGVPIMQRIGEGWTGALERFLFAVAADAGLLPDDMTFTQFVDSDQVWTIERINPALPVPDAEGNP